MKKKLLDLTGINLTQKDERTIVQMNSVKKNDIAIIGVSGRFGETQNVDEFWEALRNGSDCIRTIPESRQKDIDRFINHVQPHMQKRYLHAAYLEEIDQFDYQLFSISPKEASLMDPNQRLFLETAWSAIEDAGYGGQKIMGTRTGVFVGYSADSDSGEDYKQYIKNVAPSLSGAAVPGNIKSIIASRIAYTLDLHGPSMVIDTACSSSLVAVHLACQAINNGECDMALAGGVKIIMLPLGEDSNSGIGISSRDGRAKTFDNRSDGTGFGEGVGVVMLKSLDQAIHDKDHIYAVVKGSAFNQDGHSIGITAPNSLAQEDVIVRAWQNAEIEPGTIQYIEAHGTGTSLGDPIEIKGIQRAFEKYTNQKQFCGIGSLKTNFGHLDHAAGIAGFIKSILALKHKEIPPTVNFQYPNQKISFDHSPVYVNDCLREWESNGHPRRCGISSFGLSGTNCHIILEEAPEPKLRTQLQDQTSKPYILSLSAKTEDGLLQLINDYLQFISKNENVSIADLAYTSNTGRGHYESRLALVACNCKDLVEQLYLCKKDGIGTNERIGCYTNSFKVINEQKPIRSEKEITEADIRQLTEQANSLISQLVMVEPSEVLLQQLCQLYVSGAEIDWERLLQKEQVHRISLPVYPFNRKRCWVEPEAENSYPIIKKSLKELDLPLLDRLEADSIETIIYATDFNVDKHWVLHEHIVNDKFVVPGTTYLEMLLEACYQQIPTRQVQVENLVFLAPLICERGESHEVQTILKENGQSYDFIIASRYNGEWVRHAQGTVAFGVHYDASMIKLEEIKNRCDIERNEFIQYEEDFSGSGAIITGPRWNNVQHTYIGNGEVLAYFSLPERYEADKGLYHFHPSLMDNAVNLAINTVSQDFYLPFTYRICKVYSTMPNRFYSHLRLKSDQSDNKEIINFDVTLVNEEGVVFAEIEDYAIKRVHQMDLGVNKANKSPFYYGIKWIEKEINPREESSKDLGTVLIFKDETSIGEQMIQAFDSIGRPWIQVEMGAEFKEVDQRTYKINGLQTDYTTLIGLLKERGITQIIHLLSVMEKQDVNDLTDLEETQKRGYESLVRLTKALLEHNIHEEIEILLVAPYVYELNEQQEYIHPHYATMFGLGKVVSQEYPHLLCRALDIDKFTSGDTILAELGRKDKDYLVVHRNNQRFVEEFYECNLDDVATDSIEIRENGVYVITGGLGAIGLEMANYLASQASVNLVLINRSSLPSKELWGQVEQQTQPKLYRQITAIRKIESLGSNVTVVSADISDQDELQAVLTQVRSQFTTINGIIHSAGVAGEGFILRKEEVSSQPVLSPKVRGTWLLHHLTKDDQLDFMVLFSSINSLYGGVGQGDYTAANAYLDAFTSLRNRHTGKTLTINWAAWKEVGMAVEYGANHDLGFFKSLSTHNAIQAFQQVLHKRMKRVTIAEINYDNTLDQMDTLTFNLEKPIISKLTKMSRLKEIKQGAVTSQALPDVMVSGRNAGESYSVNERLLAQVFCLELGLDEINIYDDFFSLGGDSIIAVKIVNSIQKYLNKNIGISEIFQNLTIFALAAHLSSQEKGNKKIIISEQNTEAPNIVLESEEGIELTGMQRHIYFLQSYNPFMTELTMLTEKELSTSVDIELFQKAVDAVTQQHEALRTIFREENGLPKQVILPFMSVETEYEDLSFDSDASQLAKRKLNEARIRACQLSKSTWRPILYRLPEKKTLFGLIIHSLIGDQWSLEYIANEILQVYNDLIENKEIALPPTGNYISWIRDQLSWEKSEGFQTDQAYWQQELRNPLPQLNLATDFQRPKTPSYQGSFYPFQLKDEEVWKSIQETIKRVDISLETYLLSAYYLLLHKLTLDTDIIIGMTARHQGDSDSNEIVGALTNIFCMRVKVEETETIEELFAKVEKTRFAATTHSRYPFDAIVAQVNAQRSQRSSIFSTMFQWHESMPTLNDGVSLYDLSLVGVANTEQLHFRFEFDTNLFKIETISKLAQYYLNILYEVSNSCLRIPDVQLLSQNQMQELKASQVSSVMGDFEFNF
ncbi:type I polyketide synthase [Brevibacillus laterosporus]|uniref:Type I polyketide synthase n=2 Tax=Brevibacillus laterosporus TaxID=1465 RepID=A0AAP3GBX9_BRELA|nr:type I polyketide synthase [Brevibacillus laterosporus]MCR8981707.1 SDR family NAD(P)-dependent oxidoreductase [Brevibacillus laterosporus]MCZ0808862.1 type I polyketide synthase [Brevibacillus laterosporus]MCZ0825775.1 type I polyketide synthase [Brevibacillus laterosporus]MCZ0851171.1 type I polyketide synthase [Brevibacillus laterosporus]